LRNLRFFLSIFLAIFAYFALKISSGSGSSSASERNESSKIAKNKFKRIKFPIKAHASKKTEAKYLFISP